MLAANIPVKLESKPGAGKTSHINAMFEGSNGFLRTMVAVNHDPTDFGGIPAPAGDRYKLLPGEWAMELVEHAEGTQYDLVGLFFDEVNTAGRAVLAALLKVVDERIVGFQKLPASIRIIMAMNPAEANGGVDLTPAMANRVAHLSFEYPLKQWAKDMRTGFNPPKPIIIPAEDDLNALTLKYAADVADFATGGMVTPKDFEHYPDEAVDRSGPFPTRRTWTMAARAMAATELLGFDGMTQQAAVTSLVGKSAAGQFEDYLDTKSGFDPVAMLNDPEHFLLPDRDDGLFTALDRMVNFALSGPTQAYIDACCTILMRVGVDRPGVAASGMRNVALFLRDHREFISPVVQQAIREFKPIIDAAGGMELD
jgi:MoxR-like ATPase